MPVNAEARQTLQDGVCDRVVANHAAGLNSEIVAPTGIGKTNIITEIAKRMIAKKPAMKALIVQDRIRVTTQNRDRGTSLGLRDTTLSIDGKLDLSGQVNYATTATVAANLDKLKDIDALFIDECQHASAKDNSMHAQIVGAAQALNPDCRVIGATAYDDRHDKLKLHPALAEAEKIHVTMEEALSIGAIVPGIVVVPAHRLKNGETTADVVERYIDPERPTEALVGLTKELRQLQPDDYYDRSVAEWRKATGGREPPTFAYTSTIADAKLLHESFEAADVRVGMVHSGMNAKAIDKAFEDYRTGRVKVLVSVDMLNEGVDETKTQVILLAKQTTTRSQHLQICGRAARAHTDGAGEAAVHKTHYTVVDMGASTLLHGTMEKHRAVENFVARGPGPERGFSPWKCVEGDGKTAPTVYALHDGQRTLFALKIDRPTPVGGKVRSTYMVLEKKETNFGARKTAPVRLVKHAGLKPLGLAELMKLGHDVVKARPDVFTTLESRTDGTAMRALVKESFRQSRDSVMLFASYLAPQKQQARQQGMSR